MDLFGRGKVVYLVETLTQKPNFCNNYATVQLSGKPTYFLHYNFEKEIQYPVGRHIMDNFGWLNEVSLLINEVVSLSDKKNVVFLCRGSSGTIISAHVANYLYMSHSGKQLYIFHYKKVNESSHDDGYSRSYELLYKDTYFIAIDDFISSGETFINLYDSFMKDVKRKMINHEPRVDLLICRRGFHYTYAQTILQKVVASTDLIISSFGYSEASCLDALEKLNNSKKC